MIISAKKQMIVGDVLVDDGLHNLIGGTYSKILMTMPHNEDFDVTGTDVVRVNNWEEAYREIARIKREKEGTEWSGTYT